MSDKEHEIPVKVVDRRWWARGADGDGTPAEARSEKPTYVAELEAKLADKDRQLQDVLTKYRQASSEFEEARIRLRREISKDVERGRREIISDLLEVLDNLDRAIDSARQPSSPEASAAGRATGDFVAIATLLQGIQMVQRQFLAKLEGLGVTRIDVGNAAFDPQLHEAITTVPAASPDQDGRIVGVVRHGYRIGDDVLRPAAVAVGVAQEK
jgi:molecular chaperone GrpE